MIYLFLALASVIVQGCFSMLEMACVSFNRVRLQYFISKKKKRAMWLGFLIKHPSILFGTTLLGVNGALQFGSECARKFYTSMGVSPDWAPLSQVFLVLIFAELAPMFAGRLYPEMVSMLGMPVLYFFSIILRPVIWILSILCRFFNWLFGASSSKTLYLSREELQKAIEAHSEDFDSVLMSIFSLKGKTAKDLMLPVGKFPTISADSTVADLRQLLNKKFATCIPLTHQNHNNIIALAYPRDFMREGPDVKLTQEARSPWFITETTPVMQILKEFKKNNQVMAIVLNKLGVAVGIITADTIVSEIFGERSVFRKSRQKTILRKSFPGDTPVVNVNAEFELELPGHDTLLDLMEELLGHPPGKGDTIQVGQVEMILEDFTLLGETTISIHTL